MLPEISHDVEAALDAVYDELPPLMPHVEDVTEIEPGVPGYVWSGVHGRIAVGAIAGDRMIFTWDILGHGQDRHEVAWGSAPAHVAFLAAAERYADLNHDPWDPSADTHYADARLVGSDPWEDEVGMASLRAQLKIPDGWCLVKVVNFHDADPSGDHRRSLRTIENWLAEHCAHGYMRVGWYSSCSTKVGVAFEDQSEAFFFHLTWR